MPVRNQIKEVSFEEAKNRFIAVSKDIEDSLKKIESLMEPIDGNNETWTGKTSKVVYEKYIEFKNDFPDINSKLEDFGSHLNATLDNYRNAMAKSEKTIEAQADNYNVG